MPYNYKKSQFRPRRPVRSFRDLEVYQKALEGAVAVTKNILPILKEVSYPLADEMIKCCLDIPRMIAEAHSRRFDDQATGISLLDEAMINSNKMIVYLEQIRDIYGDEVEKVLIEELIKKYSYNRTKIFRLQKAWKSWLEKEEKQ